MKTTQFIRLVLAGVIVLGITSQFGCAYRLPVYNLPSKQRLMILARSPQRYVVRVKGSHRGEFPVSPDGRVTIDVPTLPRACSVYLFDRIRISSGFSPLTSKSVDVVDSGHIAATLSLTEITKLSTDASGYHVLKVNR